MKSLTSFCLFLVCQCMQSFVVLLNILKPLLLGHHQWLAMFPAMLSFLVLWRRERWRAVGLVERGGGNVLDTVFRQLSFHLETDLFLTFGVLVSSSTYILLSDFVIL